MDEWLGGKDHSHARRRTVRLAPAAAHPGVRGGAWGWQAARAARPAAATRRHSVCNCSPHGGVRVQGAGRPRCVRACVARCSCGRCRSASWPAGRPPARCRRWRPADLPACYPLPAAARYSRYSRYLLRPRCRSAPSRAWVVSLGARSMDSHSSASRYDCGTEPKHARCTWTRTCGRRRAHSVRRCG